MGCNTSSISKCLWFGPTKQPSVHPSSAEPEASDVDQRNVIQKNFGEEATGTLQAGANTSNNKVFFVT